MGKVGINIIISHIDAYLKENLNNLIADPCLLFLLDDKFNTILKWQHKLCTLSKPVNFTSNYSFKNIDNTFTQYAIPFSPIKDSGNYSLGIVMRCKESQVQSYLLLIHTILKESVLKKINQEIINEKEQITFAIMNAVNFGVLSIDLAGNIIYVNDHACRILNIRRRELIKRNIIQLIPNWPELVKTLQKGHELQNEETSIYTELDSLKYNLNTSSIFDSEKNKIGYVISFRSIDKVYQLVNKYTGMQARYSFDDIIGKSKVMRQSIDYAKTTANSPSTILIEGESGTGKEIFAQSIHNASNRKNNAFVAINCAAISENLIESELFGYDDGAFTGAKKGGHPGKFELANYGTLFLDEIGDMKPDMQVKLLRAIQESSITRVGGDKVIPVDVRIIAATNKNLQQEIESGRFRLDLYYRISVIPLFIPPLRERKGDLPSLIRYFLNKKSLKLQKDIPHMGYSELQQLLDYDWPGNVRELENYIEQLINLNGKMSLDSFQQGKYESFNEEQIFQHNFESDTPRIDLTLKDIEKKHIAFMLKKHFGNISKVAKILGIGRNTLYEKIKKHNIKISDTPQLNKPE